MTRWLVLCLLIAGCGQAKPLGSVEGVVRYRGAVVKKGFVTLYSSKMGLGKESTIEPDGTFFAGGLAYGTYRVAINPPRILRDQGGIAMPSMEPEDVHDIPAKYRDVATSGFVCDVVGRRMTVEFQME